MAQEQNKVVFGLSNCVFAPETATDTYSDELIKIPGAVTLTREVQGEQSDFYADNQVYYTSYVYQGYTGELEVANVPEDIETKIFGDEIDEETGIMKESRNTKTVRGAFGFQINGDKFNRRYWNYGVTLSRPNIDASTITESQEPQTATMGITVTGLTNSEIVGIKTSSKTSDEIYQKFLEQVVMPDDYDSLKAPVI